MPPKNTQGQAPAKALAPTCPLSATEIAHWAPRLGPTVSSHPEVRAAREQRLRKIIADWFGRAKSQYMIRTLPPNWPDAPIRVDEVLPEIADRLERLRKELLALPGNVTAALRVRYGNFDPALIALGALPFMLSEVASDWAKPHKGNPKLWIETEVISLLIEGVERYTGEKLPSPRSTKRRAELEFIGMLAKRIIPELTDENVRTALGHWHKERLTNPP